MSDFEIRLLGPPEVRWHGEPLFIPRRQVRALFFIMAVHLQRVSRGSLCALLWPRTPELRSRRMLSHLLTHLRMALPSPNVLQVTADSVALDGDLTWSDTCAFDRLCSTPCHYTEIKSLEQAATLYRGPFLHNCPLPSSSEFELWVSLEQSHWEQRYLELLKVLIEAHAAQGVYDVALTYASHYLAINEIDENIHCYAMALHAAAGNRLMIAYQYRRCCADLKREMGAAPSPKTTAIYHAVQQSDRHTLMALLSGQLVGLIPEKA